MPEAGKTVTVRGSARETVSVSTLIVSTGASVFSITRSTGSAVSSSPRGA